MCAGAGLHQHGVRHSGPPHCGGRPQQPHDCSLGPPEAQVTGYPVSTINNNIYLEAGEEPGPALHHGGRARHLDLQQPQAEELRSHALETSAQLKIEALSTGRRPIQGGAFSVTKNFNMDPRFQLKLTSGAGGGYCPIALWMEGRQKINIAITV